MRIDIVNGSIVTGDGKTVLENTSVTVKDCVIAELPKVSYIPYNAYADEVINARGGYIIPGIINIHAHGAAFGPFFPYAWKGISAARILHNLDNHLLQGETTILNTDGLSLPYEVDAINKMHPMNVKMCTIHTPKTFRAADVSCGEGLEEWHRKFTAEEAVAAGAVVLGEVGSPGSSYGTYEKGRKFGKTISARHSMALDTAVVANDETKIRQVLAEAGLEKVTTDEAKKVVEETSIIPIQSCCDAIRESVSYVRKLGIPVLLHAEPGMKDAILEVAKEIGPKAIVVHVNHSFTTEESVQFAKELRNLGATIECISADSFGAKQVEASPKSLFTLLKEGLVDVITTDFSGGYHDAILFVLQKAIEEGVVTLPRAIELATGAPARIVPLAAPNRGLIEPGKAADLCIVDRNDISKVRYVIIAGRVVVEDGKIVV